MTSLFALLAIFLLDGPLASAAHAQSSGGGISGLLNMDLSAVLAEKGMFIALSLSALVGLIVAFTPCVYPMYPITATIVAGHRSGRKSVWSGLFLTSVYVLGIATTYALIGILVGLAGSQVRGYLQSPTALIIVAIIFVMLGLWMIGLFEIKMPAFMTKGIDPTKRKSGIFGIFLIGLLSGLVASPCVAAPVAGILIMIATTGSWQLGFWLLFAFGWGMGIPLIILGTSIHVGSGLPKAGGWMDWFKKGLGFVMIILAVYTVLPVFHTSGPETPVLADSGQEEHVAWIYDYEGGLELAKSENKPVMIDFYADWCAPCKRMDKHVFTDEEIIAETKRFVIIKFDGTKLTKAQAKIQDSYNVPGYPSYVFIGTDGETSIVFGEQSKEFMLEKMKEVS